MTSILDDWYAREFRYKELKARGLHAGKFYLGIRDHQIVYWLEQLDVDEQCS